MVDMTKLGEENIIMTKFAEGNLTGDVITRTTYDEPAMILSLIPFKNTGLY